MKKPTELRATLSHLRFAHAVAITVALLGCGGVMTSPDAGSGCPSGSDIASQADVGQPCAPEGEFCPQPSCDPCTQNCRAVTCTNGVWKATINTGICVDSGQCVEIDATSFDQSCNVDTDCMAATSGTFCSDQPLCTCPTAAINVSSQSQYETELEAAQSLGPTACGCPLFGTPRCIHNVCTLCGGAEECPDGG